MTESCGRCVPCRVGTVHMYNLLNKFYEKKATTRDLILLEKLCEMVRTTSLCGLGQTAPNPVLSTMRYFRDEYLASIIDEPANGSVAYGAPVVVGHNGASQPDSHKVEVAQ